MTGGFSHDPVTVATAQGIPVGLDDTGPVGQYPPVRSPLRPWYSNPGVPGPVRSCGVSQLPVWTLLMKLSSSGPRPGG